MIQEEKASEEKKNCWQSETDTFSMYFCVLFCVCIAGGFFSFSTIVLLVHSHLNTVSVCFAYIFLDFFRFKYRCVDRARTQIPTNDGLKEIQDRIHSIETIIIHSQSNFSRFVSVFIVSKYWVVSLRKENRRREEKNLSSFLFCAVVLSEEQATHQTMCTWCDCRYEEEDR